MTRKKRLRADLHNRATSTQEPRKAIRIHQRVVVIVQSRKQAELGRHPQVWPIRNTGLSQSKQALWVLSAGHQGLGEW